MANKSSQKRKAPKKGVERLPADWLPHQTLEQARRIAELLYRVHAGRPTPVAQLSKTLSLSPKSAAFRQLISSALAYGLITKDRPNVFTLSEIGRKIVAPKFENEAEEGLLKAALTPLIPALVYSDYNGHPLPPEEHFPAILEGYEVPESRIGAAARLIISNGVLAGILQPSPQNDQHIVNLRGQFAPGFEVVDPSSGRDYQGAASSNGIDWSKMCFYITPIGDDGTEPRRHADMLLANLFLPVLKEFGLEVVRADKIERSGLINQQIFEYLAKARLCVADLSFSNPNAFYELGVRHVCKLPTIQIIRKGDRIPFDVAQGRTIIIDTSDVYTMVERLDSAKRELKEHIKGFQSTGFQGSAKDNPVHVYLPDLKVTLPK